MRKFIGEAIKPCGDLMEVTLFVPQGEGAQDFLLGAEARFGTMTIYAEDLEQNFEFGVSSATLRLILSGCVVHYGDRLGDMGAPRPTRTKVQQQQISKKSRVTQHALGVAGQLGASGSNLGGKASLAGALKHQSAASSEEKEVRQTDFEITKAPILPMSGDRWVFSALHERVLMARRAGDDHLCKIQATSDAITITAHFYFYPKHIVLLEGDLLGGVPLFQKLKQSRAKAAIAKTLLKRQLAHGSNSYNALEGAVIGCIFRLKTEGETPSDSAE